MTSIQRRTLAIWMRFRDRPMSVGALVWASRRTYAIMLLAFAVLGSALYISVGWVGAAFIGVAFVTAVLRDLGYFIRSARVWPALQQAIDWTRVQALLAADEQATPKA